MIDPSTTTRRNPFLTSSAQNNIVESCGQEKIVPVQNVEQPNVSIMVAGYATSAINVNAIKRTRTSLKSGRENDISVSQIGLGK
jgi:hypothetical protein